MNVFENLIDELKEENLIEETVIEPEISSGADAIIEEQPVQAILPEENIKAPVAAPKYSDEAYQLEQGDVILPQPDNDFYRRRAMEEVSALQLVERIFSGVEREYLKIIPKPYDEIPVSKALHDFLQISKTSGNPENAAAEFKLMQETESWYSALSQRDQNILPAQLRRFCETTRPVLSSQALAALARFYRNSPFSEAVRSKFDLVVTRLFSRETFDEKRELAFGLNEISQHLSELYADWASVSLYSTEDDSQLTIISLKFEDFITEAASAENFEELIKNDFFNRLRAFKVSTGENFYAPQVTATAIKCNVFIGNRFVELLNQEKENNNSIQLEEKYNFLLDQSVSEAASKTLQLIELLHNKNSEGEESREVADVKKQKVKQQTDEPVKAKKKSFKLLNFDFSINKWLLGAFILVVLLCAGLYSWVEFAIPQASTNEVSSFELDGYYFKEYIKVGKIFNNSLIAVTSPAWYQLGEDKKQEVMNNMLALGKEKGFRNVHLLSNEGKTVAYISAENLNEAKSK